MATDWAAQAAAREAAWRADPENQRLMAEYRQQCIDEDIEVDESCNCDYDNRCTFPECWLRGEEEAAYWGAVFRSERHLRVEVPSREEWDDVYSDDAGKRLAYDQLYPDAE